MLVILSILFFAAAIVFGYLAWDTRREEQARSDARIAALASAVDGDDGSDSESPAMFVRPHDAGVRRNPIVSAAAGIGVTVALVIGVAMATREPADHTSAVSSASNAATGTASLELLAMRDTRDRDTMTISGLVRNARHGGDTERITAVVLAYGRDGSLITTGKAPLEIPRLRPGEESPFTVSLPNAAGVQRYRLTFRGSQGIVRHVDLRTAVPGVARRRA
jgi:hypothetical protein